MLNIAVCIGQSAFVADPAPDVAASVTSSDIHDQFVLIRFFIV